MITGLLIRAYVIVWFLERGAGLELNVVNWSFLAQDCCWCARYPITRAVCRGRAYPQRRPAQYPLYAGMMGMAIQSGLARRSADFLVGWRSGHPARHRFSVRRADQYLHPLGRRAMGAAGRLHRTKALDVDLGLIAMSVAYGDQWTNLIQPFVAIPLLALTGLGLNIFSVLPWCCATTSLLMLGLILGNSMS